MATILVVEDNPTSLKLATVLLHNAGHAVLQAADGQSAVDMVREQRPDLVLMDVQMAGMDGLTATRILKQDAGTRQIPIVALTAFAMRGDEEKIIAAGCDAYIAKPFRSSEFLARVQAILDADTDAR